MENENTNEKKKQIRLAIIGVVAFLLLILGATFAFFLIDTDNSTSKSNIKGDISKAGVATLVPGTSNLHINLSVSDMALANQGAEYYGDELESNSYVLSEEEGTHTISQVQITDGEETTKYSCTAKVVVTMEIEEDNNMGSVLEPGDLILQFKGNLISDKLDLSELSESGTKTYDLSFRLTGNTTEDIQAYIKLINKSTNQNYLASKNLKVDINTTELSCDIYEENKNVAYLRKNTNCLTDELVYGLYRCQGNSTYNQDTYEKTDIVKNNYICLGSDCSSAESDDMYRIIGVTEDGEMKVIKAAPTNDSIAWNEDGESDIEWPESDIFSYLNNDFYQTLSVELQKKIKNTTWYYGDITKPNGYTDEQNIFTPEELEKYNELENAIYESSTDDQKLEIIKEISKLKTEAILRKESELTDSVPANIGLINLTDYCSSFESKKEKNCSMSEYEWELSEEYRSEIFGLTWMAPVYGENGTMIRFGSFESNYYGLSWYVWSIRESGMLDFENELNDMDVKFMPVFFLTSDIEISGEGTIESPFRVAGIE